MSSSSSSQYSSQDGGHSKDGDGGVLLIRMRRAYKQELRCPEILLYENELISDVTQAMDAMHDNIERPGQNDDVLLEVMRIDLMRTQYMVKSYLRQRLWKLQKYPLYYLKYHLDRLSPLERKFTEGVTKMTEEHMNESFLHTMPAGPGFEPFTSLDNPCDTMGNMIRTPNIDTTTVVAKIVDDLSSDGGTGNSIRVWNKAARDYIDMQLIKGRTYIVGYDVVKRYVEEGKVELV